jgi:hypothetical protein
MPTSLTADDIDSIARRIVELLGEKLSAMGGEVYRERDPQPGAAQAPTAAPKLAYTVSELCADLRVCQFHHPGALEQLTGG